MFHQNNNQKWDKGEEFSDWNGIYDEGEDFTDVGYGKWNDIRTSEYCEFIENGILYNNDPSLIQIAFFDQMWIILESKEKEEFMPSTNDGEILFGYKKDKK